MRLTGIVPGILALSLGVSAGLAGAQPEYDFILVDSFNANPLAGECFVWGANDQGVACGMATMDNRIGYPGFVWTQAAGKTEIPVSSPQDVNNNGLVVGNGGAYDLVTQQSIAMPTLPGTYYGPSLGSVNDAGVAVGSISTCTCSDSAGVQRIPYIWDAVNGARTLDVPNAKTLYRINNAGVALGWMNDLLSQGPFFVDVETGVFTTLISVLPPDLGVGYPNAADINDSGDIVGSRPGTYPVSRYGFVYSPGTGVQVLPFPGAGYQQSVSPASINNAGTIVGTVSTTLASQHIFVYSAASGLRILNTGTLIAGMPAGYRLSTATKINNQGWIFGYGQTAAGKTTGFVLKARATACPADFNGSGGGAGGVSVQDVYDFLAAWSASDPGADFNGAGGVTVQDIYDFLAAWLAGCP